LASIQFDVPIFPILRLSSAHGERQMTVEMIANVGGGWLRNQATSGQPGHLLSEQRCGSQGKTGDWSLA